MTDIVEQAAKVACPNGPDHDHQPNLDQGCNWALQLCQTLADAGLLAEPARTVPTREEISKRVHPAYGRPRYGVETCSACERAEEIADAVLSLMAGRPTVAEVQEQWANYITNTTGSVGNNLTLESLVKALRAPHPPFGGPHKNKETK